MTETVPRIGFRRDDRPHPVVAVAEARVIHHELERRLGPITLDLRIGGDAIEPWLPLAHAAWPADIDAVVEHHEVVGEGLAPLTSLFARTVAPEAAEVRRRMLVHLGVVDGNPFDAAALDALDALAPTPTDLWLAVSSAPSVAVDDPAIAALAAPASTSIGDDDDPCAALDAAFDGVATRLGHHELVAAARDREIARLRDERDDLRRAVAELESSVARERAETGALVDDLARRLADADLRRPHDTGSPDA